MPKIQTMTDNRKFLNTKKRRLGLVVGIVVILFLLFDITPFGGNIRFYSTWMACGAKPVRVASAPGSGVIWYEETAPFEPVRFLYQKYYCTPLEAEQAGYSADQNSYTFPHLNGENGR